MKIINKQKGKPMQEHKRKSERTKIESYTIILTMHVVIDEYMFFWACTHVSGSR